MDAHSPDSASAQLARQDRAGSDPARPAAAKPAMRASDQERDQVAGALGEALATGRLTSTEHAERIEAAYAARTVAELAPLTADLPVVRDSGGSALAAIERQQVSAVFSKVNRGGRWVAGRRTELRSTFGALIVDLSDAVLPGREIVLDANSFCGKLIVTVPGNARIIDEGGALFGKRTVAGGRSRAAGQAGNADSGSGTDADEDGPVIRVTGHVRFGKLVIHRAGAGDHRWPWRMG